MEINLTDFGFDIIENIIRYTGYKDFPSLLRVCKKMASYDDDYCWGILLEKNNNYLYRSIKILNISPILRHLYKDVVRDIFRQKKNPIDQDFLCTLILSLAENGEFLELYSILYELLVSDYDLIFMTYADIFCYNKNTYCYDLGLSKKFAELQLEYNKLHGINYISVNSALGSYYYNEYDDKEKAIEIFEQNIKMGDIYSADQFAFYARKKEDYDLSIKYYSKVIEMSSDPTIKCDTYCSIANIYKKIKNYDLAIKYYTKTLTYGENFFVYCNRALCFKRLKKYYQAIDDFQIGLKYVPDNVELNALLFAYVKMINCLYNTKNFREAAKIGKLLIKCDSCPDYLMSLVEIYIMLGKYNKAEKYFNTINNKELSDRDLCTYFLTHLFLYNEKQDYEMTMKLIDKYLEDERLTDNHDRLYKWKGKLYITIGDYDKAYEYLNKSITIKYCSLCLLEFAKLMATSGQKYYNIDEAKKYLESAMNVYLKNKKLYYKPIFYNEYHKIKLMVDKN